MSARPDRVIWAEHLLLAPIFLLLAFRLLVTLRCQVLAVELDLVPDDHLDLARKLVVLPHLGMGVVVKFDSVVEYIIPHQQFLLWEIIDTGSKAEISEHHISESK